MDPEDVTFRIEGFEEEFRFDYVDLIIALKKERTAREKAHGPAKAANYSVHGIHSRAFSSRRRRYQCGSLEG